MMNARPFHRMLLVCGVTLSGCLLGGCGSWSEDPLQSRLEALGRLNQRFQIAKRRPPASETELRDFATSDGAAILAEFQIPDVDTLFISERDGQPFHLYFGKDRERTGLFAHEQQGRDGKRMVAFAGGDIQLLDDGVFRQILPDG
jgi:hypothetical protein